MSLSKKIKGPLAVASGISLYMLAGLKFLWGFITTYFFSYHYHVNPSVTASDINIGLAMSYVGALLGTTLGIRLKRAIGLRPSMCISLLSAILGLLSIHLTFNSFLSVTLYGILLGYGSGSLVVLAVIPSWSYYWNRKGLLTGILFFGYYTGPGLIGLFIQSIANPDNEKLIIIENSVDGAFSQTVVDNFKTSIYYLIAMIIIIGSFAVAGSSINPENTNFDANKSGLLSLKQILSVSEFWKLFISTYFVYIYFLFITQGFKEIGLYYINDDQLLSLT